MGGFEVIIAALNSGRGTAGPHNLQDFKLRAQHLCCRCSGADFPLWRRSAKPCPENAEKWRAPREPPLPSAARAGRRLQRRSRRDRGVRANTTGAARR